MYMRVAEAIAAAESSKDMQAYWAKYFYDMMAENKFLPNSPTLMNAGRRLGMLSACFVLPVEDDLDAIFDSVKATALVQRAGGGTGFNFSKLRPSGSIVKSSGGTTSGPLSFIDVFSKATDVIQQGAFRRGANMGIMNIDHPDIIGFIKAKSDLKRWQNYNVSVAVTDEWMKDLIASRDIAHRVEHPQWGTGELFFNINTNEVKAFRVPEEQGFKPSDGWRRWTVGETWDLICQRAWETGEPGLFFIDKANENNPVPHLGKIEATNPCGEQPLHAFDSCNLGSINLSKFYDPNIPGSFDFDSFSATVTTAVRFLDNVITCNKFPIPEIEEMSKKTRRIGLGVMGFADLLFQLQIPYNSPNALAWAEKIGKALYVESYQASQKLGDEKGSYGAWLSKRSGDKALRNAFRTTVAPTGTISIIANCSGGIEPIFALAFKRTVMPDTNGKFKEMYEENEHWIKASPPAAMREYAKNKGSIATYDASFSDVRGAAVDQLIKIFVTSHDIAPKDHVKMQAAWQKYTDTAISKTINIAHDAPVSVVSEAYKLAYDLNCVGITVYRDGCRNNVEGMKQPMSVPSANLVQMSQEDMDKGKAELEAQFGKGCTDYHIGQAIELADQIVKTQNPIRIVVTEDELARFNIKLMHEQGAQFQFAEPQPLSPENQEKFNHLLEAKKLVDKVFPEPKQLELPFQDVFPAFRTQVKTQFGNLHVHIVLDEQGQRETEIFAQLGKAGDLIAADLEAICRLASMALKAGCTIEQVIEQLSGIGTTHIMPSADGKIVSMPDALAKGLKKYVSVEKQLRHSQGPSTQSKSSYFVSMGTSTESHGTNGQATSKRARSNGKDRTESNYGLKCPACPVGRISFQEGCEKCHSCGYSAC